MLTIQPTTQHNIVFRADKDYSSIYKEMENITLAENEKIIPKHQANHMSMPKMPEGFAKKILRAINIGLFCIGIGFAFPLLCLMSAYEDWKREH